MGRKAKLPRKEREKETANGRQKRGYPEGNAAQKGYRKKGNNIRAAPSYTSFPDRYGNNCGEKKSARKRLKPRKDLPGRARKVVTRNTY